MEIKKIASAGFENNSDLSVTIEPFDSGIDVNIFSSMKESQYKVIQNIVDEILNSYGIVNAKFTIKDYGAPPFVIKARVETAIKRSSLEIEKKFFIDKLNLNYQPLRSIFKVNLSNARHLSETFKFKSDAYLLDLYKNIPLNEKDSVRILGGHFLKEITDKTLFKIVKINPLDLGGNDDIDYISQFSPDMIMIPKCETEYDVKKTLESIEKTEKKYKILQKISLIPSIESAKGLVNLFEIASVSDRIFGVSLDIKEYILSLALPEDKSDDHIIFAKLDFIKKVKAVGVMAFETTISKIENMDDLKNELNLSWNIGFDGKIVTNPKMIEMVHSVFRVEGNIEKYENISNLYTKSSDASTGIVTNNFYLVDKYEILKSLKMVKISNSSKQRSNDV